MRATVYPGPYEIRVEEKEIPRIGHPDDTVARVMLTAICGRFPTRHPAPVQLPGRAGPAPCRRSDRGHHPRDGACGHGG